MERNHTPHVHFEGRSSRVYNFLATKVLRRFYRRLAQDVAAVAPPNAAVLDIGTGPGVLLAELAELRPDLRLSGVDLSPDMVEAAARNLASYADRATVRVGDVAELPFADDSFDLIVSSLSLHHWEDPEAAVPQLARVLRPGGRLRIYDFSRAPFDRLAAAARDRSVLNGQTPERTRMHTGVPFFRCVKWVMSS